MPQRENRRGWAVASGLMACVWAVCVLPRAEAASIVPLGRVIGVASSPDGALYYTDEDRGLFEVRQQKRLVTGDLLRPRGVAFESAGRVLVLADGLRSGGPQGLLARVDVATGAVTVLASGLANPRSVTVSGGTVYLTVAGAAGTTPPSGAIDRWTPSAGVEVVASGFEQPDGLVVLGDGSVAVAAAGYGSGAQRQEGSAFRLAASGAVTTLVSERLRQPSGLAIDGTGVVFLSGQRASQTSVTGVVVKFFPGMSAVNLVSNLSEPRGLAFRTNGELWVADHGFQILVPLKAPPAPVVEPFGSAFTREGTVHVRGTTQPFALIAVLDGQETAVVLASETGAYDTTVSLRLNQRNDLRVFAIGFYGMGLASPPTSATLTHDDIPPNVVATSAPAPNGAGWNQTDVTVSFACTDTGSGIAVCPSPVVVSTDGDNQTVTGEARDQAGNTATASATVRLDKTAPAVTIAAPADGTQVETSPVTVSGTVSEGLSGLLSVTCNGLSASVSGTSFSCSVPVSAGNTTIQVSAVDVAGNTGAAQITVGLFAAARIGVVITSPASLTLFRTGPVIVTGTLDRAATLVVVNGIQADLNGQSFTAAGVPLVEGHNVLTATATGTGGAVGTGSVTVSLDSTPPTVRIDTPTDGAVVTSGQLTVTGMINDIVSGTVNDEQATVTVNGVAASISNRSFVASDVLLVRGQNTVVAVARDRAGNESRTQVRVSFADVAGQQRIEIQGGNNQSGVAGTTLTEPLLVGVTDAFGRAIVGRPVTFTVARTDGTLKAFPDEGRTVTVLTDDRGQASVLFQLGTRTGAGNNQVSVSSPGFVGEVTFQATATVGAPVRITADAVMGESFRGATSSALPSPLVAIVFDVGGNPVSGVPVTFTVTQGGGFLDGDKTTVTKNTDTDGKVSATFSLGSEVGINNNAVTASFEGPEETPVVFTASGLPSGAAAQTRVSGIVVDNTNNPIPNAHARIADTSLEAFSNDQGQFTINGVPVGTVLLEVDGSTSTRPETFPILAFHLTTVSGQDNTVGMPIYLPPLDTPSSQVAGGDQAVTLSMSGVPGVAFTIAPRSVTFKDGSKVGRVILSQVHADKVPMPPPFGTAPRIMWTLQPPGARFNPPIQVQLPNVDSLPPGQVVEVFQFDHDLEQFVSVGAARVSADGSVIVSDAGFGITKSGWGGSPPPPPPPKKPCAGLCGPCKSCILGSCVPNPFSYGTTCNDGDQCTVNDSCNLIGQCTGEKVEITNVEVKAQGKTGKAAKLQGKPVNFTVDVTQNHCTGLTYNWTFGDGGTSTAQNPTHTYATTGDFTVTVTVKCGNCTTAQKQGTVHLISFKATIEKPTGDPVAAGSADNEFVYMGAAGRADIPVKAKIDPASAASDANDLIKWTLVTTPAGSALTWASGWPSEPTAGKGTSTTGTLTGYPALNSEFGARTVRMQVVDNGTVDSSEDAKIELFFERDAVASGRTAANWFFYWNQTAAGEPNAQFAATSGAFGTTPAMLQWATYAGPRRRITIDNAVTGSDARRDGSHQTVSGIDLFANTRAHENGHVTQIFAADGLPYYTGVTGRLRDAAGSGWSFNIAFGAAQWNHFTDNNANGTFEVPPDTDLDTDRDDLANALEITAADRAKCFSSGQDIECQAELNETIPEDTHLAVDWASPGKQHRTKSALD